MSAHQPATFRSNCWYPERKMFVGICGGKSQFRGLDTKKIPLQRYVCTAAPRSVLQFERSLRQQDYASSTALSAHSAQFLLVTNLQWHELTIHRNMRRETYYCRVPARASRIYTSLSALRDHKCGLFQRSAYQRGRGRGRRIKRDALDTTIERDQQRRRLGHYLPHSRRPS